jgi:hypothetical protein
MGGSRVVLFVGFRCPKRRQSVLIEDIRALNVRQISPSNATIVSQRSIVYFRKSVALFVECAVLLGKSVALLIESTAAENGAASVPRGDIRGESDPHGAPDPQATIRADDR